MSVPKLRNAELPGDAIFWWFEPHVLVPGDANLLGPVDCKCLIPTRHPPLLERSPFSDTARPPQPPLPIFGPLFSCPSDHLWGGVVGVERTLPLRAEVSNKAPVPSPAGTAGHGHEIRFLREKADRRPLLVLDAGLTVRSRPSLMSQCGLCLLRYIIIFGIIDNYLAMERNGYSYIFLHHSHSCRFL